MGDGSGLGPDSGVGNTRITSADGYGYFSINLPHQGQVTVNRTLDYERTQRYLLTLVASVCGNIQPKFLYFCIIHNRVVLKKKSQFMHRCVQIVNLYIYIYKFNYLFIVASSSWFWYTPFINIDNGFLGNIKELRCVHNLTRKAITILCKVDKSDATLIHPSINPKIIGSIFI